MLNTQRGVFETPNRQMVLALNSLIQLAVLMMQGPSPLHDAHLFFFATAVLTAADFHLLRRYGLWAFSVVVVLVGVFLGAYGELDVRYWAVGILFMGTLPLILQVMSLRPEQDRA